MTTDEGPVLLAHGEGGRLSRRLIREVVLAELGNPVLDRLADAAVLPDDAGRRLAVTTDAFVVSPLFFPGGDIGRLAVHGTVNDLACAGAEPFALTLAAILEEGLPVATLRRVLRSVAESAAACGIRVVAGDTKVVPRGAADGLFLTATGLGRVRPGVDLGPHRLREGDRILVSGTLGDHGITVLSAREGSLFEGDLASDTAPVTGLVAALYEAGIDVRFLRDPTRGGASAALREAVEGAALSAVLDEAALPVSPAVRGACELLGLDPIHVANEGKLLAVVPAEAAAAALAALRSHRLGRNAGDIGAISADRPGEVFVRTRLGALRVVDEPAGAPLPRIC